MEQTYTGFNLNQKDQEGVTSGSIFGVGNGNAATPAPNASAVLNQPIPTGNLATAGAAEATSGGGGLSPGYANFLKGIFGLASGIFMGGNGSKTLLGPVGSALAGNPLTGGLTGKALTSPAASTGILGKLF